MGGHVIAVKRTVYGDEEFADEVYAETDLDKVLPRADIIASSVPGTHETYKLFNQEKFDLMKENAIFLNVGRGTNVGLEFISCFHINNICQFLTICIGIEIFFQYFHKATPCFRKSITARSMRSD